ncbi:MULTISPECIES: glycosyltransferase [unclassified Rhizobium]
MSKIIEKRLSICIVTYKPDWRALETTLRSLSAAIADAGPIVTQVILVDNSPINEVSGWLAREMPALAVKVIAGHGNIGYGRANNLAMAYCGDYHLVLNPDVEMDRAALKTALQFMNDHPSCGLLSPAAMSLDGSRQFLCKRYPSLFDLFLRGFAPQSLKTLFRRRLDLYEMRDKIGTDVIWDPPIVSGCFMLFRRAVFQSLEGFYPGFMLYFEDFDLSIRAGRIARIAFVPNVKIVHGGGGAARKGYWHIWQFVRSAAIFFSRHTLKVI